LFFLLSVNYFVTTTNASELTEDSSAMLQKMIDSKPSGTTIKLPSGTYKVSNTVKLKNGIKLVASNDVIIKGTGDNTLFSVGNDNSFEGIEFQNCSTALSVYWKKGLKVTDCRFTNNIYFTAINFYGSSDSSVTKSYFYQIHRYGVLIDHDSSNIRIDNNKFDNAKAFGGYDREQISGHVYSLNGTDIKVTNNILRNSGGQGVIFGYNSITGKGTTNSVASNNLCVGNGQEGATIYGGVDKVTSGNSLIHNTSKNNRFNQIEVWESDNNLVQNNTVEESLPGTGNMGAISLFATSGTTVSGNKVLSAQNNGIEITAGSTNCAITDNHIADTNVKKNVDAPERGNAILLDSNGKSQPKFITIRSNEITASNEIIQKSGIYSTSNENQNNKIDSNTVTGYKYGLHSYAYLTQEK
jgi:parallel beta-helix repeat protein